MSVREIVTVGHPVLRERAREVTPEELATPETQQFIDDLIDTMRHANGAGIAANQVGVPIRIATIEVGDNPRYPVQAAHPADRRRQPDHRADRRRAGRDQRGLPLGAEPARVGDAQRQRARPIPRSRRRRARRDPPRPDCRHVPARVRSPRWRAVPRPSRRPDARSRRGSSSSGSTAPRSSSGSRSSSPEWDRDSRDS